MNGIKWLVAGSFVCFSSLTYASEAELVWPELQQDGSTDIYYAEKIDGQWSNKQIVVDNGHGNYTPAFVKAGNGNKMIVWIDSSGQNNAMYYRFYSTGAGGWTPINVVPVLTEDNYAPDLTVDSKNQFWLTWSGNNGDDDDIYLSVYNSQWQTTEQITDTDDYNEGLPHIQQNAQGLIEITWDYIDETFKKVVKTVVNVDGNWMEAEDYTLASPVLQKASRARSLSNAVLKKNVVAGDNGYEDTDLPAYFNQNRIGDAVLQKDNSQISLKNPRY